jgi:hypothetical protein
MSNPTMKRTVLTITVAFVVTATAIFGIRASTDALAVVLGVILGVAASVPTTFLVTYLLARSRFNQPPGHPTYTSPQPPVVVINSPDKPAVSTPPALTTLNSPTQSRKWTVIGDSDTE